MTAPAVPPTPSSTSEHELAGHPDLVGPYKLGRTVGQGIFAKVRLGEDDLGRKFAIKVFEKKSHRSESQLKQVEREINALRILDHPSIVQFFEVLETGSKVFLVMEFVSGGELYEFIHKTGKLPERDAARLFYQICSAVQHCHNKNIAHRDLKPENILLSEPATASTSTDDGLQGRRAKIVDFGLTNFTGRDKYGEPVTEEVKDTLLKTQCGSPHYAAPEVLQGKDYKGRCVDVWSLGIILYAMLCARLPFHAGTVPQLMRKIVDGYYQLPDHLSTGAKDLIQRMLKIRPEQRLTIDQVIEHPWIQSHGPHVVPPSRSKQKEKDDDGEVILEDEKTSSKTTSKKTPTAGEKCPTCGKYYTLRVTDKSYVFLSSFAPTKAPPPPPPGRTSVSPGKTSSSTPLPPVPTGTPKPTVSIPISPTASEDEIKADLCTCAADQDQKAEDTTKEKEKAKTTKDSKTKSKGTTKKDDEESGEPELDLEGLEEELFGACESGHIHRIKNILAISSAHPGKVNLDAQSVKQWTGLHYAAYMGHLAVAEALVTSMQKLNVNAVTENGWTPLMLAADRGHIDIARVLIEVGANIHIANKKGKTAIYVAREKEHYEIAALITEASTQESLQNRGMDADASFRKQLFRAAEDGDAPKLKLILNQHFPKEEGSGSGSSSSTSGPSPSSSTLSTSPSTTEDGKGKVKFNLGTTGIDNWTALHHAARKGHVNAVNVLLTYLPNSRTMLNIDVRTKNGWTPLMLAADRGHTKAVQLLVQLGANVKLKTSDDKTALDLAKDSKHSDVVKILEKAK